jgi:imidazoleglycerol phosphate dehydratase HisB
MARRDAEWRAGMGLNLALATARDALRKVEDYAPHLADHIVPMREALLRLQVDVPNKTPC